MDLRGLFLLLLFLTGGARRSIRTADSHQNAQQSNMIANSLEVSAESQETLIPSGSGTGLFRRAGQKAGAMSEGLKQMKNVNTRAQSEGPSVGGRDVMLANKFRNTVLAGLASVGLMCTPFVADAVDVKMGSNGGQLVFVPDEVTIKAGESVTWVGNKGMPHNVVFDEEAVPDGTNLEAINHEDMVNDEGEKVTSKFTKAGTYAYYCEPHRGAGMNGVVIVK